MAAAGLTSRSRLQVLLLLTTIVATFGKQDSCDPTVLDMTAQGFTMVPQVGHMVEMLELSDNNLTIITTDAFHAYPNVKDLRLSHNTVHKIEAGAFSKLQTLMYVDLSSNNLTFIHPCTFCFNFNLEKLFLQHNPLQRVDVGISILVSKSLQFLNLRYCGLTELRVDNFEDLPSLEHLYLSYNTSERPITLSLFTSASQRAQGCALTATWESELDGTVLQSVCWPRGGSKHTTTVNCITTDEAEKPVDVPTEQPTVEDNDKTETFLEGPTEQPTAQDGNLIIPLTIAVGFISLFVGVIIGIILQPRFKTLDVKYKQLIRRFRH